jgi:hypothetical protein
LLRLAQAHLPLKEAKQQEAGVSPAMLDVQEQTNAGANTVTFTLTPEMIATICKLYPAVKRAYQESVPAKACLHHVARSGPVRSAGRQAVCNMIALPYRCTQISEQDFWRRYLQSQRFHERNGGIKADDIFTRAQNEETRGAHRITSPTR